jgi:hypothetical protein
MPMNIATSISNPYTITWADDGRGIAVRQGDVIVLPSPDDGLRGLRFTLKRVGAAGGTAPAIQGTVDGQANPTLPTVFQVRNLVCAGVGGWFFLEGLL